MTPSSKRWNKLPLPAAGETPETLELPSPTKVLGAITPLTCTSDGYSVTGGALFTALCENPRKDIRNLQFETLEALLVYV